MNPPIREASHRDALWQAVREGLIDVIGSDHAPHTREEKTRPIPTRRPACRACRRWRRSCSIM
jgi:dihydroorotase-like cyclic amidohydrolase